jgi:hypothetical protein
MQKFQATFSLRILLLIGRPHSAETLYSLPTGTNRQIDMVLFGADSAVLN